MQSSIPQSSTPTIALKVKLSSDHVSPATGKTVAITISKAGAAFGNPSAGATNATEIGNGWYYVTLSATDTGTLGPLVVLGTAASCDNSDEAFQVVDDPADAIIRNQPINGFEFYMSLSSDHYSPATGMTVTATRSLDGGGPTACTNSPTEVGNGLYAINLTGADLNGGTVQLSFSATGADTTLFTILTVT